MSPPIYLDNHATTVLDPAVASAMLPLLTGFAGNPSSPHIAGARALEVVEHARLQVASLVGARGNDVVFTSGATEANNLVLLGLLDRCERPCKVVSSVCEHSSILEPLRELSARGVDVELLPVDSEGRVVLSDLERALGQPTALVSVAVANGETGCVERVEEICTIAHERGVMVHADGAQAAGRVPIDMTVGGVDFLTISAHKLHGPQGIGALIASGRARRRLRPILHGGGQERGLRSGTVNVAGVVGFGVAARLAHECLDADAVRVGVLRDCLLGALRDRVGEVTLNGPEHGRLAHNLNVRIAGVDAEALIATCPAVCFSAGSACTSGALEPSHVLLALGLQREAAAQSVRFGLSRFTTAEEIARAVEAVAAAALRLRAVADAPIASAGGRR